MSDPSNTHNPDHKSAVGRGGHRIDASRNFWDNSGLKIDSASTDVAWGHGAFNNKILTSARNGELIMWDLNKSGVTKYERRTKDHIRSIHKLSVSHIIHHYCITGSADGDMRVWDLRDFSRSILRVHHPTSVRSLVFSPSLYQPLQAVVGLDNGSIYRWDLRMGQRGQLDRLPVAHGASVMSLDWCSSPQASVSTATPDITGNGLGWLVSAGLDKCVKVWDLSSPGSNTHIPQKPTYTLHPSFPVRRVLWRPGYECELALVSNIEYGAAEAQPSPSPASPPGTLASAGSSLGLDAMMRAGNDNDKEKPVAPDPTSTGDAVEIWDVRRGWIGKWSLTGTAGDGGVNDIAFGDSHALWAQHSAGSFSQIDLRDVTKPLDAVPRVAATWEATGTLAFVSDRKMRWEIPYDDLKPSQRGPGNEDLPGKALGDDPAQPTTQRLGAFAMETTAREVEVFTQLARGYIFAGEDRRSICIKNAQVALEAGQERAVQVWLLMGAALSDYIPDVESTPTPRYKTKKGSVPPPISAPPVMSTSYTFPSSAATYKTSPGRRSVHSAEPAPRIPHRSPSASAPRKLTPSSSAASSPRHVSIGLPPMTPNKPSFFSRRESLDSGLALLRRPSLSTTPGHSASPSERSSSSLRHLGEGALSDSDSSPSEGGEETPSRALSGDEQPSNPTISPILHATRGIPTPSPLSIVVAQRQWPEDGEGGDRDDDEDEESSPSPGSTDTESEGSSRRRQTPSKSVKRNVVRLKSRNGSSTVASLAVPQRQLVHQDSHSSIRTVTAVETSFRDQEDTEGVKAEDTVMDLRKHKYEKSQAASDLMAEGEGKDELDEVDLSRVSERRIEIIHMEEKRFREMTWEALRDALEDFAVEGEVQLCAMLSVVAHQELRISNKRVTRFLDAYTEHLTRLRLYACAAYVRKFSQAEDLRNATLLETTIYTSCGKCKKAIVKPAGTCTVDKANRGGYSYCATCKSSCVTCSICRLPVRALLFQCSVCSHGGHQSCYHRYYIRQPMVELPRSFLPAVDFRGRTAQRNTPTNVEDDAESTISSVQSASSVIGTSLGMSPSFGMSPARSDLAVKLIGHLCAAGCGHYCWAANRITEGSDL